MIGRQGAALGGVQPTEALVRFAVVGMQSMLVLYLVVLLAQPGQPETPWPLVPPAQSLDLTGQPPATAIIGSFLALIYPAPVGGGVILSRLPRWQTGSSNAGASRHRRVPVGADPVGGQPSATVSRPRLWLDADLHNGGTAGRRRCRRAHQLGAASRRSIARGSPP